MKRRLADLVKPACFILSFSLLASACTEIDATTGATPSGTTEIETTDEQKFPLDEYLSVVYGSNLTPDEIAREQNAEDQRQNELIAECLHDAGFEGDLAAYGWQIITDPIPDVEMFPNDRDWVAQWGYGIVASDQFLGGPHGIPEDLPPSTFSAAEKAAFHRALMGGLMDQLSNQEEGQTWSPPQDWTAEQYRELGCLPWARHMLMAEFPAGLSSADEFRPLFEAIEQMQIAWRRDISPEEVEWAACMADAGFVNFERRIDPDNKFDLSLPEQLIDDARAEILKVPANTGEHDQEFADLLEKEINLALADLDCRIAVNFNARSAARRIAAETQFVNDHRAELEALRAAAEQRSIQ